MSSIGWPLSQDLKAWRELTLHLGGKGPKMDAYEAQQGGQWDWKRESQGKSSKRGQAGDRNSTLLIARISLSDLENQLQELSREMTWGDFVSKERLCLLCCDYVTGVKDRRPVKCLLPKSGNLFLVYFYENKHWWVLVCLSISSISLTSVIFWTTSFIMWLAYFKCSMVTPCLQQYVQPLHTNLFKIWPQYIFPD